MTVDAEAKPGESRRPAGRDRSHGAVNVDSGLMSGLPPLARWFLFLRRTR